MAHDRDLGAASSFGSNPEAQIISLYESAHALSISLVSIASHTDFAREAKAVVQQVFTALSIAERISSNFEGTYGDILASYTLGYEATIKAELAALPKSRYENHLMYNAATNRESPFRGGADRIFSQTVAIEEFNRVEEFSAVEPHHSAALRESAKSMQARLEQELKQDTPGSPRVDENQIVFYFKRAHERSLALIRDAVHYQDQAAAIIDDVHNGFLLTGAALIHAENPGEAILAWFTQGYTLAIKSMLISYCPGIYDDITLLYNAQPFEDEEEDLMSEQDRDTRIAIRNQGVVFLLRSAQDAFVEVENGSAAAGNPYPVIAGTAKSMLAQINAWRPPTTTAMTKTVFTEELTKKNVELAKQAMEEACTAELEQGSLSPKRQIEHITDRLFYINGLPGQAVTIIAQYCGLFKTPLPAETGTSACKETVEKRAIDLSQPF